MKRKLLCVLLLIFCLIPLLCVPVSADFGPKPVLVIRFENLGDELCYGTFLSKYPDEWRLPAWDGTEEDMVLYGDLEGHPEIWRAFADYEDPDGFYFVQLGWKVSESKTIDLNGTTPTTFKILLYYPESGRYVISEESYDSSFFSFFTVTMDGYEIQACRSFSLIREWIAFVARAAVTLLIEIGIALIFGYRSKKQLTLLLLANLATQVMLNLILSLFPLFFGEISSMALYIGAELWVTATEAAAYRICLPGENQPKELAIPYALIANALSCAAGFLFWYLIPFAR